ncbi:hypothetical protein LguiA_002660 [Lonicera macranthoides]
MDGSFDCDTCLVGIGAILRNDSCVFHDKTRKIKFLNANHEKKEKEEHENSAPPGDTIGESTGGGGAMKYNKTNTAWSRNLVEVDSFCRQVLEGFLKLETCTNSITPSFNTNCGNSLKNMVLLCFYDLDLCQPW